MKIITQIKLFVIAFIFIACGQNNSNNKTETTDMKYQFPFKAIENNENFTIVAEIESEELLIKYLSFFEKFGYEGNGYCWEGHVIQILEKLDKELLNHVEFDPEAGAFYAYADSKETQDRFIGILNPIFSDLTQLEQYVKIADRNKIDD